MEVVSFLNPFRFGEMVGYLYQSDGSFCLASGGGSCGGFGYGRESICDVGHSKYGYGYGKGIDRGSGEHNGSGLGVGYFEKSGHGRDDGGIDVDEFAFFSDGIKKINGKDVYMIDGIPTLIDTFHADYAKGSVLNNDFTLTPCFVAKVGGYYAHGESLKMAMEEAMRKFYFYMTPSEVIALFNAKFPDRDKKIPAKKLFEWHNILTGSCLMGRKLWCRRHNIDIEKDKFTVNEFIALTKDDYGGDVIRELEETK